MCLLFISYIMTSCLYNGLYTRIYFLRITTVFIRYKCIYKYACCDGFTIVRLGNSVLSTMLHAVVNRCFDENSCRQDSTDELHSWT